MIHLKIAQNVVNQAQLAKSKSYNLRKPGDVFPSFFLRFLKEGCWLFKNMSFLLFYIYFHLFRETVLEEQKSSFLICISFFYTFFLFFFKKKCIFSSEYEFTLSPLLFTQDLTKFNEHITPEGYQGWVPWVPQNSQIFEVGVFHV